MLLKLPEHFSSAFGHSYVAKEKIAGKENGRSGGLRESWAEMAGGLRELPH
jgi:hypothetical protein